MPTFAAPDCQHPVPLMGAQPGGASHSLLTPMQEPGTCQQKGCSTSTVGWWGGLVGRGDSELTSLPLAEAQHVGPTVGSGDGARQPAACTSAES